MTQAIQELAHAEGAPVAVRHVCRACAKALVASGVALHIIGDLGLSEVVYTTDPVSGRVAELEVTLGEGPAGDALVQGLEVLVPDLTGEATACRWPMFAPGASAAGVAAVFAFPLVMGMVSVGSLEVYRATWGDLSADEVTDGLLFAEAAMRLLIERMQVWPATPEDDLFAEGFGPDWAVIHQATGMVSIHLQTDLTSAFLRLRAQAYLTDRGLSEVAHDVVTDRLRFIPDPDNDEQS
ncbi:ANTAR domain-containing protein [Kutzneria sp. CA-103260]|uniref:ANTAR domain-containing protein n=1 Tax=Kutzneria sp. CA-103260 TaxID=2802641 RepID=UPI001BA727C0|nr:ANTAR domain-containing protein [Kutzneria sp. CA-103260]